MKILTRRWWLAAAATVAVAASAVLAAVGSTASCIRLLRRTRAAQGPTLAARSPGTGPRALMETAGPLGARRRSWGCG
jgi:hypothetical protein